MRRRFTLIGAMALGFAVASAGSAQQPGGPAPGSAAMAPRIAGFQADAAKLAAKVDQDQRAVDGFTTERSGLYAGLMASISAINDRLQAGTTPGNPDLVAEWQRAQATLTALDDAFAKLSRLSAALAETSGLADYLANSVHAALDLPGATDSDHQQLVQIEAAANDASDHVRRLIDSVDHDMEEQAVDLDSQHRNLVTLRHAVDIGAPLGNNLATMGRGPAR